jgi:CO/xanthine dehydrogenase FAD-binding subunit
MKPAAFEYVRPRAVAEAVRALAAAPDAKVLAGGQTLGPMLNLRLAQPGLLVDITRIPELAIVEEGDAIANAFNKALERLGAELLVSPITPRRIAEAFEAASLAKDFCWP